MVGASMKEGGEQQPRGGAPARKRKDWSRPPPAGTRKSARVAELERKEHAVALAAVQVRGFAAGVLPPFPRADPTPRPSAIPQDHFSALGEELQRAEEEEARERFAQEIEAEEARQGRVCVMLEPMSDAEDSDDDEEEEEEEESEEVSEGDSGSEYEEDSADEDYVPEDPYARLQGLKRVFVPEEAALAYEVACLNLMKHREDERALVRFVSELVADAEKAQGRSAGEAFPVLFGVTVALSLNAGPCHEPAAVRAGIARCLGRMGALWTKLMASSGRALGVDEAGRAALDALLRGMADDFGDLDFRYGAGAAAGKGKAPRA